MTRRFLDYASGAWDRSRVGFWARQARDVLRERWRRVAIVTLALCVLVPGVWALVWWARYPSVPDPAKLDAVDALNFMATDDFNRMTEAHRKRYAIAAIERLREKGFKDLLSMGTGGEQNGKRLGDRGAMARNIMKLSRDDQQEIGGAAMRLFLDKFYELSKADRNTYLTLWAMGEKFGGGGNKGGDAEAGKPAATRPAVAAGKKPEPREPRIPKPEELERAMGDFLRNQPPKTVAQMGQLMEDMRKKRAMLGIKQPW